MKRRDKSPDKDALRECWTRWTGIVELFARRRTARKRVDLNEYASLHRNVIRLCRVQAGSANEVDITFYRYLEDLVQPWLDPQILARAERDILFDLLIRCQHVEAQLGGRAWLRTIRSWGSPALLGTLCFAIIVLCMGQFPVLLSTVKHYAVDWSDDLYLRVVHSSDLERLFVVGLVLIAVSIYTVSRTARS
jgi:hypothetical protein